MGGNSVRWCCYPAVSGTQKNLENWSSGNCMAPGQSGTLAWLKTVSRVWNQFYWVNLQQRCVGVCTEIRGPTKKSWALLQHLVGLPMKHIALVILGPLTVTNQGNKYLVFIADYSSIWTEAFPMPDQEASTVADLLVKVVICCFGVPLLIHSDWGRNLILFCKVYESLGMKKTETKLCIETCNECPLGLIPPQLPLLPLLLLWNSSSFLVSKCYASWCNL